MVTQAFEQDSVELVLDGDLEAFLERVRAPDAVRAKLVLAWRAGIRRTVHARLPEGWVIGFSRARYRGFERLPEAYCKPRGSSGAVSSQRFERLLEAMSRCRAVNGFVRFGMPTRITDSHLKVSLREAGLALNVGLFELIERATGDGRLERRVHPESGEWYVRVTSVER